MKIKYHKTAETLEAVEREREREREREYLYKHIIHIINIVSYDISIALFGMGKKIEMNFL